MRIQLKTLMEFNYFTNSALNSITSAVFIVDEDLKVLDFNDTFSALFYKEDDKIIGSLCGKVKETGLGKTNIKKIITEHKGETWVESELNSFTKKNFAYSYY